MQQAGRLTEAAVRALVKEAESEAGGDRDAVVLGLDRRVRARWGDFESFPISIVRREDLTITLSAPFMAFRRAIVEHLRMREPLDAAPWSDHVVIDVSPDRLEAPDIVEVAVTRDGVEVAPVSVTLRTMTFQNGRGEKARLHAGEVRYATSGFAPGAEVQVTAVPGAGEPLVVTLSEAVLRTLK